jgi:hypothetical protein
MRNQLTVEGLLQSGLLSHKLFHEIDGRKPLFSSKGLDEGGVRPVSCSLFGPESGFPESENPHCDNCNNRPGHP